MKTIILTGKFGMGHISAANAIKENLEMTYGEGTATIIDLVEYLFPNERDKIVKLFDATAKQFPGIYNCICRLDAHSATVPMKRWFARKFRALINDYEPDAIISTWPVASKYVGFYKTTMNCDIPFFTCITDISAHNMWLAEETNAYFAGSDESKEELVRKGVSAEKIYVSGIPVRNAFKCKHVPHEEKYQKNVLIMGGGLGIIPGIDNMLETIERSQNMRATVITGNNVKLRKYLEKRYKHTDIVGFTKHVDIYMKRADIVITKAGGISMFEAIHAGTPIMTIKPFLEQERNNAAYIEKQGIGVVMDPTSKEFSGIIASMMDSENQSQMRNNMRRIAQKCDSIDIAQVIGCTGKGA